MSGSPAEEGPAPLLIPLDLPDLLPLLEQWRDLPDRVLLDGAADHSDTGRWSCFAADPVARLVGSADEWPAAAAAIRRTSLPHTVPIRYAGGWIGWLGYELGRTFDRQPVAAAPSPAPDFSLALYDLAIVRDNLHDRTWLVSTGIDADGSRSPDRAADRAAAWLDRLAGMPANTAPRPVPLTAPTDDHLLDRFAADFTPDSYRDGVARLIGDIRQGEIFQANLTQRWTAAWNDGPLALYRALRAVSPAPFGAYIEHDGVTVLSSSPELFLSHDAATGRTETRPIKGTRPRGATSEADEMLAAELLTSAKDRAENVMIVDLMRNDLHRVCNAESVEVEQLCRLESHPTVHHLVSVVSGTLREECDALDLIAATFPAGSITGAPKLRSMELLAEIEPVQRGVYCGSIIWFGNDGSMSASVAIRTMVLADGVISIHAGGGITARSQPDEEYLETIDKARGMMIAVEAAR